MNKRAYYFSLDAFIALIIIVGFVFLIKPSSIEVSQYERTQEDLLEVLSMLRIDEINNSYVQQLIDDGNITNLNQTVLEQIGEFYSEPGMLLEAQFLAQNILDSLDFDGNIGIYFNNIPIAVSGDVDIGNSEKIQTSRQIISGVQEGNSSRGFSSRAFLSSTMQKKYFYFGGYNGDGNISFNLDYTGDLADMMFEIAINDEFDLYINDQHSGHYAASPSETQPIVYDPSYESYFHSGSNTVKMVGDNLHIAGGYVKIVYENPSEYEPISRYYFSGIEGLINIYDSFYIPGILNEMSVYLHYDSDYAFFLNIGNISVFNESSDGETSISIDDAELSSKINYAELNRKTIPLRLGLEEISGTVGGGGVADIVFLIDSTGSMYDEIQDVKKIINNFTYVLENSSIDYRLGLIEFQDYPISPCGGSSDFPSKVYTFSGEEFTNDTDVFRNTVNSITLGWGNDGPESHLRALNESLDLSWRENAVKYNILLTDAPPHAVDCLIATWNYWWCYYCLAEPPWFFCGFFYDPDLCVATYVSTDLACNLGPKSVSDMTQKLVDKEIKVFHINKDTGLCGNRIIADNMTNLTGGRYYSYTETQGVEDIILNIAGEIVNITYSTQTAVAIGGINTILYPDSYIYFNYTADAVPYGLVTKIETPEFGNAATVGSFYVPEDSEIIEANVVSYSGAEWTDNVYIYNESTGWENIFSLQDYGDEYIKLGDPYVVNLPWSYLKKGNNDVKITTGISPAISTGGSASDKVIYSIVKDITGFSRIVSSAEGCEWTIEFEDNTISIMNIPLDYSGIKECYYTSDNVAYNENDAIDNAIFDLLSNLDLNSNNKVDTKFSEDDLTINSVEVPGIPFTWETEVQTRIWQ